MNEFFMDPLIEWERDLDAIVKNALREAETYGLSAMDSLHVAAALLLDADQFVTTESTANRSTQWPI